jgi:hypothetical protein
MSTQDPKTHAPTARHTSDGQPYYSAEDAQAIFNKIAHDPRQPFRYIRGKCGMRCELAIAQMIEDGIAPETLGRILMQAIPSMPNMLTPLNPLYQTPTQGHPTHSESNAVLFTQSLREERGALFINSARAEQKEPPNASWSDHIAPTLRVMNKKTGAIETMVLDPVRNPQHPINVTQWHMGNSVMEHAVLGNKRQILWEYLPDKHLQYLKQKMDNAYYTPREKRNNAFEKQAIVQQLYDLDDDMQNYIRTMYQSYVELSLGGKVEKTDWHEMNPQDFQKKRDHHIKDLKPYVDYQQLVTIRQNHEDFLKPRSK